MAPAGDTYPLDPLHDALFDDERIEVPVYPWPHTPADAQPRRRLLRVSAQIYNDDTDYDRLAAALSARSLTAVEPDPLAQEAARLGIPGKQDEHLQVDRQAGWLHARPRPQVRARESGRLEYSLRANDDVRQRKSVVRKRREKLRVERAHAVATGPALPGWHDLVRAVVRKRGQQARDVPLVLSDRVLDPQAFDRAQLGVVEPTRKALTDVSLGHVVFIPRLRSMRSLFLGVVAALLVGCTSSVLPASPFIPVSGPCAGIPQYPPDKPPGSLVLTPDPALEAEYPTTIDGQPVTDIASARYIESLCALGGDASIAAAESELAPGVDLNDISVATGNVVVDGQPVTIDSYRLPNHRGDELVSAVGVLATTVAGSEARFTDDLVQTTAGGRSVLQFTNAADGSVSYLYATGDTLFIIEDSTQSQADKIVAALP